MNRLNRRVWAARAAGLARGICSTTRRACPEVLTPRCGMRDWFDIPRRAIAAMAATITKPVVVASRKWVTSAKEARWMGHFPGGFRLTSCTDFLPDG
jgi:hypothetical protein